MIYNANKLVPIEMAITSCVEQAIQPVVNELVKELLDDRLKMLMRAQVTRILEEMDLTRIMAKAEKPETKAPKKDKLHAKVLTPETTTPAPQGECTLDDILNSQVDSTAVTQTSDVVIPVFEEDTSHCASPEDL